MRLAAILCCALALAGCATGYVKDSIFGGHWDEEGPGELITVGYNGNGYTKGEKVEIYLLYRSAEVARERGKPYFTAYQSIRAAIVDAPLSEATVHALGGKPFGKVYIMLHDGPVPGGLEATDVLAKYAEAVKRFGTVPADGQGSAG